MTQYIIRRLIQSLFIIWGCATLVFFLLRMIPGDPVIQSCWDLSTRRKPPTPSVTSSGSISRCTSSTSVGSAMC